VEGSVTLNTTKNQSGEHLRLLDLCFRYAHLDGRRRAGLGLGPAEEEQLEALSYLFEGDPERRRRQYRRFPTLLHAVVKTEGGLCSGEVLNMSGAGMYLALSQEVEDGSTVQVKVGRPGEVEYLFTCDVVRADADSEGETSGVGLAFCCIPLEMRRKAA
jgi:hypothetical protein